MSNLLLELEKDPRMAQIHQEVIRSEKISTTNDIFAKKLLSRKSILIDFLNSVLNIWRQHDQIIISNLLKPDFQPNRQVIVPIYKFTTLCQKPGFIVRHDKVPRLFTNFGFVLSKYDSKD